MTKYSFMKQDNTAHTIISTDESDLSTVAAMSIKDLGLVKQDIKVGTGLIVCNVCSKPFKFKRGLNNHMKKVHETSIKDLGPVKQDIKVGTGLKVCNVCSRPFKFKSGLNNHIKKVHGTSGA